VSTLDVVPTELTAFADGHREVAGKIEAALDVNARAVAVKPGVFGTVGAMFTAAVDDFEAAFMRTAAGLAGDYRRMSEALDVAAASYLRTDQVNEAALADAGRSVST
jgi:Excreted virulence factor EspC, type VII ESX diderm